MRGKDAQYQRELEAIAFLRGVGYIVSPPGARSLSWNRTAPFPPGVDFKQEALESLRSQLTLDHIHFTQADHPSEPWPGGRKAFTVHTGKLYLL